MINKALATGIVGFSLFISCEKQPTGLMDKNQFLNLETSRNVLDFQGTPQNVKDRDMLMYSDQGAWFAYSFSDLPSYGGFSGPFLMTQQNGVWVSKQLAQIELTDKDGTPLIDWQNDSQQLESYTSHLMQEFKNERATVNQQLVFSSPHTALQQIELTNLSNQSMEVTLTVSGRVFEGLDITLEKEGSYIKLLSKKSQAVGYIGVIGERPLLAVTDSTSYTLKKPTFKLGPKEVKKIVITNTFIFPEYSWNKEKNYLEEIDFDAVLLERKIEKNKELSTVFGYMNPDLVSQAHRMVLAKSILTLQNNWRIPAGELKHQGLFPSYHYEWFHGFWSWDSWKHAVGLSFYNEGLAKDQIRAMFDFQLEDGFIVDCVYRDTTIEAHNYRDTKPPLAAWAVSKVFGISKDTLFVKEMYPKLKKYHEWWYMKRDHDGDGLCEFGSTDGSLIAAKWESGMDNAIRFDDSKILKNSEGAFSLNQESVDLNAYLYAEKEYLSKLALVLGNHIDSKRFQKEADELRGKIQTQFYSEEDGWFYDTSLDGTQFIKGAGSEGWTPLWAKVASLDQARAVKEKMMNPEMFFTKVPFQTMAKDHPKFDPMNGYWRGPNWLDQAYFGIKGLRNYGFNKEADLATINIINGAEGLLKRGVSIRENYHPLTGKGYMLKF